MLFPTICSINSRQKCQNKLYIISVFFLNHYHYLDHDLIIGNKIKIDIKGNGDVQIPTGSRYTY